MRRPRKRRAPIEAGNEFRFAHVLDVENHEAAVPVTDIKPVAGADRMVTALIGPLPVRLLAARRPLSRHPPAPDFLGLFRIFEVDDLHDIAAIALELRRAVDIAAVEGETVHAARRAGPDVARLRRIRDIENLKAAAEARILSPDREDF